MAFQSSRTPSLLSRLRLNACFNGLTPAQAADTAAFLADLKHNPRPISHTDPLSSFCPQINERGENSVWDPVVADKEIKMILTECPGHDYVPNTFKVKESISRAEAGKPTTVDEGEILRRYPEIRREMIEDQNEFLCSDTLFEDPETPSPFEYGCKKIEHLTGQRAVPNEIHPALETHGVVTICPSTRTARCSNITDTSLGKVFNNQFHPEVLNVRGNLGNFVVGPHPVPYPVIRCPADIVPEKGFLPFGYWTDTRPEHEKAKDFLIQSGFSSTFCSEVSRILRCTSASLEFDPDIYPCNPYLELAYAALHTLHGLGPKTVSLLDGHEILSHAAWRPNEAVDLPTLNMLMSLDICQSGLDRLWMSWLPRMVYVMGSMDVIIPELQEEMIEAWQRHQGLRYFMRIPKRQYRIARSLLIYGNIRSVKLLKTLLDDYAYVFWFTTPVHAVDGSVMIDDILMDVGLQYAVYPNVHMLDGSYLVGASWMKDAITPFGHSASKMKHFFALGKYRIETYLKFFVWVTQGNLKYVFQTWKLREGFADRLRDNDAFAVYVGKDELFNTATHPIPYEWHNGILRSLEKKVKPYVPLWVFFYSEKFSKFKDELINTPVLDEKKEIEMWMKYRNLDFPHLQKFITQLNPDIMHISWYEGKSWNFRIGRALSNIARSNIPRSIELCVGNLVDLQYPIEWLGIQPDEMLRVYKKLDKHYIRSPVPFGTRIYLGNGNDTAKVNWTQLMHHEILPALSQPLVLPALRTPPVPPTFD